MLAVSIPQPWATLIAEGKKTILLLPDEPAFQKLWRAEVAIHATEEWDQSAFKVIRAHMPPLVYQQYLESPNIVYPMAAVICRAIDVKFCHYFDPMCSFGALEDVSGKVGCTIGSIEKCDPPVPHEGGSGLWEGAETQLRSDKTGQVILC